ncbi:hypothetical protein BDQ17DRAFT_955142 [Cyathus striatus]|nr:hypothetical protein BDQ17DRAFT_955142 [Cyathus striatus]
MDSSLLNWDGQQQARPLDNDHSSILTSEELARNPPSIDQQDAVLGQTHATTTSTVAGVDTRMPSDGMDHAVALISALELEKLPVKPNSSSGQSNSKHYRSHVAESSASSTNPRSSPQNLQTEVGNVIAQRIDFPQAVSRASIPAAPADIPVFPTHMVSRTYGSRSPGVTHQDSPSHVALPKSPSPLRTYQTSKPLPEHSAVEQPLPSGPSPTPQTTKSPIIASPFLPQSSSQMPPPTGLSFGAPRGPLASPLAAKALASESRNAERAAPRMAIVNGSALMPSSIARDATSSGGNLHTIRDGKPQSEAASVHSADADGEDGDGNDAIAAYSLAPPGTSSLGWTPVTPVKFVTVTKRRRRYSKSPLFSPEPEDFSSPERIVDPCCSPLRHRMRSILWYVSVPPLPKGVKKSDYKLLPGPVRRKLRAAATRYQESYIDPLFKSISMKRPQKRKRAVDSDDEYFSSEQMPPPASTSRLAPRSTTKKVMNIVDVVMPPRKKSRFSTPARSISGSSISRVTENKKAKAKDRSQERPSAVPKGNWWLGEKDDPYYVKSRKGVVRLRFDPVRLPPPDVMAVNLRFLGGGTTNTSGARRLWNFDGSREVNHNPHPPRRSLFPATTDQNKVTGKEKGKAVEEEMYACGGKVLCWEEDDDDDEGGRSGRT